MNSQARKAYKKAYYQQHKEEIKAYKKAYKQAHKEETIAYQKAYYQEHKEAKKAYKKAYYQEHKEAIKAYWKAYYQEHKEQLKAYAKADVNSFGESKQNIRLKSIKILKKMNLQIPGYEIHHCFGYEDASKFIYISKSLHLKIHQHLRDNNIDASRDHWNDIKDILNSTYEYMYIKR